MTTIATRGHDGHLAMIAIGRHIDIDDTADDADLITCERCGDTVDVDDSGEDEAAGETICLACHIVTHSEGQQMDDSDREPINILRRTYPHGVPTQNPHPDYIRDRWWTFLVRHVNGGITMADLAREEGVTPVRIRQMAFRAHHAFSGRNTCPCGECVWIRQKREESQS